MFGKLDQQEMDAVLRSQIVARIACQGERIYIVPISYAYDGKNIYFHSRYGLKADILRMNPNICFQVDEMQNMANWRSVVCWGKAKELTDHEERDAALQALLARKLPLLSSETTHLFPDWPFNPGDEKDVPGLLFKIEVEEQTGRFERSPAQTK